MALLDKCVHLSFPLLSDGMSLVSRPKMQILNGHLQFADNYYFREDVSMGLPNNLPIIHTVRLCRELFLSLSLGWSSFTRQVLLVDNMLSKPVSCKYINDMASD